MDAVETLSEVDIIIRLCLGFLAGGIIGFERSSRRQIAGLRTHILIAVGATCLMLVSIWLPQKFNVLKNGDPGRIAAQVVSGIGFLGAGAMIRLGNNIKGLTTAASLWLIAAIGMAIGAGMYVAAAVAEALSLFTLALLERLEKRIFPRVRNKFLIVHYKHNSSPDTTSALEILKNFGISNQSTNVNQGLGKGKNAKVRFLVSIPETVDISKLVKAFKSTGDINQVEIKEKF
jgi:putative Mg2+ transporter-C (MgtC) family protein